MQKGLQNKEIKYGVALWLIPINGVAQLACYLANRHYSNALYDAKFVEELMEDSDEEAYDQENNNLSSSTT